MNPNRSRLLAVDYNPASRLLLGWNFAQAGGMEVTFAEDIPTAFALLRSGAFDLILLHVIAPGLERYPVYKRLRSYAELNDIPLVVIASNSPAARRINPRGRSAIDYLTVPFSSEQLLACVDAHLALRRTRHLLEQQTARLKAELEAHRRSRALIECLSDELKSGEYADEIIGDAPGLKAAVDQIDAVADISRTVLILGESGTGKELLARRLHARSPRRERPFVKIDCAGLPQELIDSELFGSQWGLGGDTQQLRGRWEFGAGGTFFLDEVGLLPLDTQEKLLRLLEERPIEQRSDGRRAADVHLVAASSKDLQQRVTQGLFLERLYRRLNVWSVAVPPLRERRQDIPRLIAYFTQRAVRRLSKRTATLASGFVEQALVYEWPGNVRELENAVERAVMLEERWTIDSGSLSATPTALHEVERNYMLRVLDETEWVIEGPRGAAQILGLNPSTLRSRLRRLGIAKRAMGASAAA